VVVFAFETAFHIFRRLGRNSGVQQDGGSGSRACITDPTIATNLHTSRSSTTRESMGDVNCPYTPPIVRRHWRSPLKPPKLEVKSGPAALQEDLPTQRGRCKPLDKLPPSSGLWPVFPILGFRVPGDLPTICLSLTINRASENVTKPPEHPQQMSKPGENSQKISDSEFQLKTHPISVKPALVPQFLCLIGQSSCHA
jgi:hypothetical protein